MSSHNINWKKKRGNRRHNRYYSQNYDYYEENSEDMRNVESTASTSASANLQPSMPEIPGFYIDPNTRKYYKIMPNFLGMPEGSTQLEIEERKKIQLLQERLSEPPKHCAQKLSLLLKQLEVNATNRATFPFLKAKWNIENERLRLVRNRPSHIVKMTGDQNFDNFVGCKYLYLDDDGTTLLGCWGVKHFNSNHQTYPSCARVVSYNVKIDSKLAEKDSEKWDKLDFKFFGEKKDSFDLNTYGLNFQFVENSISVNSTLVDMVLAPADIDVTCLLYATANSLFDASGRIVTRCRICLTAIDPLTKEEGKKMMGAPVYNTEWETKEPIWSVAFNSNNMQVGVGMERCGLIYDVLSEKRFKVTSGNKNVIAQEYSNEGNYLYMGRHQAPMSCLDLRMQNNHQVAEFKDSKSTSFIRQMRIRSNYILSEKFGGEIKLWDIRMRRVILHFEGHKNLSHKVPCFVDNNEQFVFAIGEDSIARGWSLSSGKSICEVPCAPSSYTMSDFPRLVYSNRWGGANGNSALVLAINGDLHVHELLL